METVSLQALKLNQLKHVNDIEPLNVSDACLQDIRDVLVKHGCQDRLGISLLHKHFDLAPDEVLLERCDERKRILTIRPVKRSMIGASVIETQWRFDPTSITGQLSCDSYCPTGKDGEHYGYKDHG